MSNLEVKNKMALKYWITITFKTGGWWLAILRPLDSLGGDGAIDLDFKYTCWNLRVITKKRKRVYNLQPIEGKMWNQKNNLKENRKGRKCRKSRIDITK